MMVKKEFIVRFTAYDDDKWALTPSEIYQTLTDAVGYSGRVWVDDVKAFVPPGQVFTGKIPAIKYLRSLLTTSLVEAKDVIDAATHLGKFRLAGGIVVDYDPSTGHYTISDGREKA